MKKQFFHYGTKDIYEDLMQKVSDSSELGKYKLSGGLWLSNYQDNYRLETIEKILRNDSPDLWKIKESMHAKGALITLKENANIFHLDSDEKFNYLKEKYPSDTKENFFSFEKLSKDYDGISMDVEKGINSKIPEYKTLCGELIINSVNLFNLNAIDYYQSADIVFEQLDMNSKDLTYKINIDNEIKHIKKEEVVYTNLLELMRPEITTLLNEFVKFKEEIALQIKDLLDQIYIVSQINYFNCENDDMNSIIFKLGGFNRIMETEGKEDLIRQYQNQIKSIELFIMQKMNALGFNLDAKRCLNTFAYITPNVFIEHITKYLLSTKYNEYVLKNNINQNDFLKYISRIEIENEENKVR